MKTEIIFFVPFESLSTSSTLSTIFKIMQDIRKIKLVERAAWRKCKWRLADLWFSFWFLFWLWLGGWITGITCTENEILKLQYQYLKICNSQLLKLPHCILYPPVHSKLCFNILIRFQLLCIYAKFKPKLFHRKHNRKQDFSCGWHTAELSWRIELFGVGVFFQTV